MLLSDDSKSGGILSVERRGLNLHHDLSLVSCAFTRHLPGTDSPHPTSFVFSWRRYLRLWLWLLWRVTQFSWVSPMYTESIHVIKLVCVFLLLLYLLLQKCLSQEPRKVEGKLFFFLFIYTLNNIFITSSYAWAFLSVVA